MTTPSKPSNLGQPDRNPAEVTRESAAFAGSPPPGCGVTPQVVGGPEVAATPGQCPPRGGLVRPRRTLLVGLAFAVLAVAVAGLIAVGTATDSRSVAEAEVVVGSAEVGATRDKKSDVAPKVDGELVDVVRKLLDQRCRVRVTPIGGPPAIRTVEGVHELKPNDRLWHIGIYGNEGVAALDTPGTLAVLQAMPETVAGRSVAGFGIAGGVVTAGHVRAVHAAPPGKHFSFMAWIDVTSSDEAVAELRRFAGMDSILFARVKGLTVESVASIAVAFPDLDRLSLMDLDLPPESLGYLRTVKLEVLEIQSMPQIDDSCVESIAAIKTLTHLTLKGCKLTPEGVTRLAVALPRCRIE